MSSPLKDSLIPPISPLRRKRLHTEDNIRLADRFSASNLKKARINTLQNEEESLTREPSLRKASSKLNLSPIKYCISTYTQTKQGSPFPASAGQRTA